MQFIKIDPPGTFCTKQAIIDLTQNINKEKFFEIGCGEGEMSKLLLENGNKGLGIDFSEVAIKRAEKNLQNYIKTGEFQLVKKDIMNETIPFQSEFNFGYSIMVMEHVQDDLLFIKKQIELLKDGGYLLTGVPGRKELWCIEDETVGHLRRYDIDDLKTLLAKAGLQNIQVFSIAVPIVNMLFWISNFIIAKSEKEMSKTILSTEEQTKTSGTRDIPFKTVFPPFFKLLLNRYTLYPLFIIQRLFYKSNKGVILFAIGQVKK